MKRKITYALITTALVVGAFFVGKYTVPTQKESEMQIVSETNTTNNWWEDYCESETTITDWNTDGDELVLSLSNGIEIYATKSETVYSSEHKNYIAFDNISDISKANDGTITITDTDGNEYTVNTKGE